MQEAQDAFVEAVNDATDLAAENWEDWYIRTNTALDDASLSMQNYADEVGDRVEQLGEEAERAEEDVWNMSDEFSDAYSNISDTVGNFLDEYSNYIDAMIEANQELVDSINQVIAAYAELSGMESGGDMGMMEPDDYEWINLKEGTGEYDWHYRSQSTGQDKIGDFDADYTHDGTTYRASYKTDASGSVLASDTNFEHNGKFGMINERIVNSMDNNTKATQNLSNNLGDWARAQGYAVVGMASGGYTGTWGSQGKLAMLHEKELVLNEKDTSNILSAVDMIRAISNTIDLNALAAGSAFVGRSSAILSSLGGKDSLEQTVHITAEFPSVNDHNEIEQALSSLIERAAQFAGRKKF
ncbi:MAG: hypothetical protein LIR50_14895 [Bacillota bacterium]|nr:hypothetical protein [Bacillota bacterium]